MWWRTLIGVVAGLALVWLVLVALLYHAHRTFPERARLREALRLLPDLVRLLRRLAGDTTLPRGVRVRLWLLLAYLAMPIDLVPDVIPVLGYADDAIVIAMALRSVARHAGPDGLARHWPGGPEGLRVVCQLAGIPAPE